MTENESNMTQTQAETFKKSGLGVRLRKAREAMSLTEKEAAAHLHLSINIIGLIENERFSDGPPPTFMRGYLRSYARFLSVPDQEISHALQELELTLPPKAAPAPVLHSRPIEADNRYMHGMTYLIILVLVVFVALWWHSQQHYNISDVPTKLLSTAPSVVEKTPAPQQAAPATATQTPAQPPAVTISGTASPTASSVAIPTTSAPVGNQTPAASPTPITAPIASPAAIPPAATNSVPTASNPSDATPPQVDTPPILSSSSLFPDSALVIPTADQLSIDAASKPSHKHKSSTRHGTLPGRPGVNMALPEPGGG